MLAACTDAYIVNILYFYIKCFTYVNLFYHDYFNRSKDNEVLVASDQMNEHHQVTKLTATLDQYEEEMTTFGYAVVGAKNVRIKLCIQSKQLYYYHLASYIRI